MHRHTIDPRFPLGEARRIAAVAEPSDVHLMFGCNDESRISIAAALHLALSCSSTRYLDLDGSLDLARDVAEGGFVLKDGVMRTSDGAGTGRSVTAAWTQIS